ncbi:NAD(P)-dependent oxidoreductase [Jatrophihabitans telluris]|uniref:NAD(P)-dependent oxidoreductase n=1 Tax=Jatrophihabitans telluris TaxID=2038343 RepID=A0ABY4R061_9ACTN|nr:NAD(P)-dependent oxidoreductase [Jatrophihabitans telluris]
MTEVGGFELTLWNRTRSRAEEIGVGTVCDTAAKAIEGADVVVTSLFDPTALRQVFLGPDGLVQAADHQVFLETSTAGPDVLTELDETLSLSGSQLIDSPLLGSTGAVLAGSLDIILGCTEAAMESARPVLAALGEARIVGPVGAAARLKLLHNSMLAIVSAATAEMMVAAVAAGIDKSDAFAMLTRISPYMKRREDGFLHEKFDSVSFAMTGVVKDLDLAIDLFHRNGSALPVTALSRELYADAVPKHGHLDMSAVIRRYQN